MENLTQFFTSESSIYVLFAASLLGGLISSISPCSLSMLPLIIGYIGGFSQEKPLKTLAQMIIFVMGTGIVFSIIGIICALTGKIFVGNPYFALFVASVISIMGLKIIGAIDFDLPVMIKEIPQNRWGNSFFYPLLLGAVFALIGTPCSTPILASIMAFASISANVWQAVIMLFLFSIGQGLIFIIAGFLTSKLKSNPKFYNLSEKIMKISGLLLIIVALYIFYKIFGGLLVK
ncbi:MAG: cytochrome c biogenesis protein CcdA [Cyanobacteria bacterium SIG26]|nr:cytochrome c biogenesis protein CcdA [Cyanobacteria bacterium SIG26]